MTGIGLECYDREGFFLILSAEREQERRQGAAALACQAGLYFFHQHRFLLGATLPGTFLHHSHAHDHLNLF